MTQVNPRLTFPVPRRYRVTDNGSRARVVLFRVHRHMFEGFIARWTESCSGCCYEDGSNDGCAECGYTGKRREAVWVPFDGVYAALEHAQNERQRRRDRLVAFFRSQRRVAA